MICLPGPASLDSSWPVERTPTFRCRMDRCSRIFTASVVIVLVTGYCVGVALICPIMTVASCSGLGDAPLYEAIVDRVRLGADYYQAAEAELTIQRYPKSLIFHWRTPVYAWLLSRSPDLLPSRVLFLAASALSAGMTFEFVRREAGGLTAWAASSLSSGLRRGAWFRRRSITRNYGRAYACCSRCSSSTSSWGS